MSAVTRDEFTRLHDEIEVHSGSTFHRLSMSAGPGLSVERVVYGWELEITPDLIDTLWEIMADQLEHELATGGKHAA